MMNRNIYGLRLAMTVVMMIVAFHAVSQGQSKQSVDDTLIRFIASTEARHRSSRRNLNNILREHPEFWPEVYKVAARLKTNPAWLLNVMACESLFIADARNPLPGQTASGLLQIIDPTARSMGTTARAIRQMPPLQQLHYVERYLEPFTGRLNTLADVYTAVLRGEVIEGGNEVVIVNGKKEQRVYSLNKSLDLNKDGYITKGELGLVAFTIGRFMPTLSSNNRSHEEPHQTRSIFIRARDQR